MRKLKIHEMTEEQMIEHWCDIVRAVFKAEDAIPEIWNERLREAKTAFEDDAVVGKG